MSFAAFHIGLGKGGDNDDSISGFIVFLRGQWLGSYWWLAALLLIGLLIHLPWFVEQTSTLTT